MLNWWRRSLNDMHDVQLIAPAHESKHLFVWFFYVPVCSCRHTSCQQPAVCTKPPGADRKQSHVLYKCSSVHARARSLSSESLAAMTILRPLISFTAASHRKRPAHGVLDSLSPLCAAAAGAAGDLRSKLRASARPRVAVFDGICLTMCNLVQSCK